MSQTTPASRPSLRIAVGLGALVGLGWAMAFSYSLDLAGWLSQRWLVGLLDGWFYLSLVAVGALFGVFIYRVKRLAGSFPRLAAWTYRLSAAVLTAFLAGVGFILLYEGIYEPIKFNRLIDAVESARTPQEEWAALARAARWGHVWEVNRLRPQDERPARARALQGMRIVELEWLETSFWSGVPYRAYRDLLDERSLNALAE